MEAYGKRLSAEGGVEGDGHGMSIRRGQGGGKRFLLRRALNEQYVAATARPAMK